jgi:hypothetical protein
VAMIGDQGFSGRTAAASAALRPFCASCWGAGAYLEEAPNGEGMVPRPCPNCDGARSCA